ncbi:MAG: YjjG family noncanonical pyrimidine nucleotidase [Caldilineales bacterium]|nr:YjjG family noncanonical pyrimidine nucleotidase [Caldilineales bacterium]
MKYDWILFDADGTLFDFHSAEKAALRQTFAIHQLPFDEQTATRYIEINNAAWVALERGEILATDLNRHRFSRLFESLGFEDDPNRFGRDYLGQLATRTELIDGAEELVKNLAGIVRLALITNGLKDVQRPRLAASAIADCFDVVVISEEVGAAKPDIAYFDIVFERMGWPNKARALVVGDNLSSDIQGAANYGIDACWFNPARRLAPQSLPIRYEIAELAQLATLNGLA